MEVLTVFNEFDPIPKIYLKGQEFWSPKLRFCEVGKICNCPLLMFHYVCAVSFCEVYAYASYLNLCRTRLPEFL